MGKKIMNLERNLRHITAIGGIATLASLYTAHLWDKDYKYTLGAVVATLSVASLGALTALYQFVEEKLFGIDESFEFNINERNLENQVNENNYI
jgi:hypothetical protein